MVHIASVFGSAKEVSEAVKQAGLQNEVSVQTPLQLIFGGDDYSLGFDKKDSSLEDLSKDISFVIGANEETLKKLNVTLAPMSAEKTNSEEKEGGAEFKSMSIPQIQGSSEEEIFSALELSMEVENIAKDHARISDVGNRVLDAGKDTPIIMTAENSVIEKARIKNSSFVNFIFQPADAKVDTSVTDDELPITISYSKDEPPVFTMNTASLNVSFEEEEETNVGIHFTSDGKYIFAQSSACAYSIESFTPGILTAVAVVSNDEGEIYNAVYSWEVHSSHMIPLTGGESREVFEHISQSIDDDIASGEYEEDTNYFQEFLYDDDTHFVDSWVIDSVDVNLLRSSFSDDFSLQVSHAILDGEDEDDEEL